MNCLEGIGDWGLGIGDWGLGPIPNPPSPIPIYKYIYIYYIYKLKKIFRLIIYSFFDVSEKLKFENK